MKLNIRKLISLDVYRDGGSLSVTYEDDLGIQYKLMFSIDKGSASRFDTIRVFRKASLIPRTKSESVTSARSLVEDSEDTGISWQAAADVLIALQPFMVGFVSKYLWVYHQMVLIARNGGRSEGKSAN